MNIVCSYKGENSLDETLDDKISYLLGKYCYENKIDFKILNLDFVNPEPSVNDELVRYQIELGASSKDFNTDWILSELEMESFEKGLTIKSEHEEILYADEFTADIQFRRELKRNKRATTKATRN